jgi:hypothetical protein
MSFERVSSYWKKIQRLIIYWGTKVVESNGKIFGKLLILGNFFKRLLLFRFICDYNFIQD